MKSIIFLSLVLLISCASEEDPQPVAKVADIDQTGTGCQDIITTNAHSNGVPVVVTAEIKGCYSDVVLLIEARAIGSKHRKPSACDRTEQTVSFASPGSKLHLGLFTCGGNPQGAGLAYKLTIAQGSQLTVINGKIGNTIEYTVK